MAVYILSGEDSKLEGSDVDTVYYSIEYLLNELVERHYQLRLEFDHSTMAWYAYYAGKANCSLFDKDEHWDTSGDTPEMALVKLLYATLTE